VKIRFILAAVACIFAANNLSAAVLREAADAAKGYEGKTLYLRKTLNQSRKVYLSVPLGEFFYEYKKSRLFPLREAIQVRIDRVQTGDNVQFSLSSRQLGRTEITLKSADGSPITREAVEAIPRPKYAGLSPSTRRKRPVTGAARSVSAPFRPSAAMRRSASWASRPPLNSATTTRWSPTIN
jgi:hypothetical protein